jgi:hypothetical protein
MDILDDLEHQETGNAYIEYLRQKRPKEYEGYLIAKSQLGSSFNIIYSIGFIAFSKEQIQKTPKT